MLKKIVIAWGGKMSMMDSDFVGYGVVYRIYWAMMHRTLQKFLANSYFVKKI